MRHLTIRDLPQDVARALDKERRRRKASLNQTVKDLLARSLGVATDAKRFSNGLARLAGTWSEQDLREFERAAADFEKVDDDVWR